MGPFLVVFGNPGIQVSLQLVERAIDLLAEHYPVELVKDGAMEALADAVGLRALGLGAGVVDALDKSEIDSAFAALVQLHVDTLVVAGDPFLSSRREQLVALPSRHAAASIYAWR